MKLTIKYKIILIITIAFLALVILYFLVNMFLITEINDLRDNIYDSQVTFKIYEDQKNNMSKIQSDFKKVKDESLKLSKVFIVPERALDFISTLENIASENQLIQQISLQEINTGSKEIQKVNVQLNVEGDYFNIVRYLNQLGSLEYYINITNLSFSKFENQTRLNLKAESYWKSL